MCTCTPFLFQVSCWLLKTVRICWRCKFHAQNRTHYTCMHAHTYSIRHSWSACIREMVWWISPLNSQNSKLNKVVDVRVLFYAVLHTWRATTTKLIVTRSRLSPSRPQQNTRAKVTSQVANAHLGISENLAKHLDHYIVLTLSHKHHMSKSINSNCKIPGRYLSKRVEAHDNVSESKLIAFLLVVHNELSVVQEAEHVTLYLLTKHELPLQTEMQCTVLWQAAP